MSNMTAASFKESIANRKKTTSSGKGNSKEFQQRQRELITALANTKDEYVRMWYASQPTAQRAHLKKMILESNDPKFIQTVILNPSTSDDVIIDFISAADEALIDKVAMNAEVKSRFEKLAHAN